MTPHPSPLIMTHEEHLAVILEPLTPEQKIEMLFFDILLTPPIPVTTDDYERQMEAVAVEMREAA